MINRKISSRRVTMIAAAAAASLAGNAAFGQTTQPVTWVGTTGDYNTAANWSHNTTPTNAAQEFLQINNGGTATVSGTGTYQGAFLNLGLRPLDTGRLEISGGTITLGELRVGGRETIADDLTNWGSSFTTNGGGTGVVVQSGGIVSVTYSGATEPPIQSLYVGDAGLATGNTANGSYTISDGQLIAGVAADDAIVVGTGVGTLGTFVQSGGTVTSTGFLTVARAGANASYTLSGGTLNVGTGATATSQNLRIGDGEYPTGNFQTSTTGTFTQTNGTATVKNDTTVGRNSGTGSFSITGSTSTFNAENNINVGHNGTGTFVQGVTGGTGP
ncbi:MAG: hypothetical protein QOE14_371, partial [Humisphaera sp.]|nr:hypothetical protein [Humisphaera sp.]